MGEPAKAVRSGGSAPDQRLESWKEIAVYLGRDVTTVQRWEKREGMPVHRHLHDKRGSVYAVAAELDAWIQSRRPEAADEGLQTSAERAEKLSSGEGLTETLPGQNRPGIRPRWVFASFVAFLVVLSAAYLVTRNSRSKPGAPSVHSLAVLPLNNLSGDASQDYLADGITEELIGRLADIRELRVISRTTSMRFKNTSLSVPEICKQLHVDAVVEGSVVRQAKRIRIHAQLIRGDTDEHFWSETYDRDVQDVLGLEAEVAQSIARKVQVTVTGEEQARLGQVRSVAPEVYESYLKGLFALDKGNTEAEIDTSIAYFERAINGDPDFASAYIGLGEAYLELSTVFYGIAPEGPREKGMQAVRKALQLDPASVDAHVLMAEMLREQWQWNAAYAEYQRALQLNPSNATAHLGLAHWLTSQGRLDEALAQVTSARDLDPVAASGSEIAWVLFCAHRYDEAVREARSVIAIRPEDAGALMNLGFSLIANNQAGEAVPVLEKALSVSNRSPAVMGLLVRAYAHAGRRANAVLLLSELKARKQREYVPAAAFVNAYLGLDDHEQALIWLNRCYSEHSNILLFLKVHPYFDPLRSDPKFQALVRRAGLG